MMKTNVTEVGMEQEERSRHQTHKLDTFLFFSAMMDDEFLLSEQCVCHEREDDDDSSVVVLFG